MTVADAVPGRRSWSAGMARLAALSLVVGAVAEGVLIACMKFGEGVGSCGPSDLMSFIALVGHVPAFMIQSIAGHDFSTALVFTANGAALACMVFAVGAFVLLVQAERAA